MVIILVEKREMNSKPRAIKKIVLDELLTCQQKSQRDISHCFCDSTYYQVVFSNVNVLKQVVLKLLNSLELLDKWNCVMCLVVFISKAVRWHSSDLLPHFTFLNSQ